MSRSHPRTREAAVRRGMLPAMALAILLSVPGGSRAATFPVRPRIGELAMESDAIVIAKVKSIRGLPMIGRRWARADVIEILKGPRTKTVEYLASPTYACDVADARRGETVLLFLTKDKELGWTISHSGRGRMPLHTLDGKQCAAYYDVIFPEKTPHIDIPRDEEEFGSAVELAIVRALVTKALEVKK